jgi:hypothetical protein
MHYISYYKIILYAEKMLEIHLEMDEFKYMLEHKIG